MAQAESAESIARKIVTAGFRALCLKNHPDTGGSHNAMIALQRGKEWLDSLLDGKTAPRQSFTESQGFNDWFSDILRNTTRARQEREHKFRENQAKYEEQERQREADAKDRERQRQERRSVVEVNGDWTTIHGMFASNYQNGKIVVKFFERPLWVPCAVIAKHSAVKDPGDFGDLIVSTQFAKRAGVIEKASL